MNTLWNRFRASLGYVFRNALGSGLVVLLAVVLAVVTAVNPVIGAGTICIVLILALLVLLAAYSLAESSILFTFVEEGTKKAVVRGESFDHLVMSYKGYHLNDPRKPWFKDSIEVWEVVTDTWSDFPDSSGSARELANRYDTRSAVEKIIGAYWVGLPPWRKVYSYKFEWNELRLDKKDGAEKPWSRYGVTDFIYVKDFTYVMVAPELKTLERLSVDAVYFVTVGITNGYKALFRTEDWLKRTSAATDREARDFIGARGYDSLVSEYNPKETDGAKKSAGDKDRDSFSAPIQSLSEQLMDESDEKAMGLAGHYGVAIRAADLRRISLSGEAEKQNAEAVIRVYRATQEAQAIEIEGKARANVIEITGKKEALALKARVKVLKDAGEIGAVLVRQDTITDASKNPATIIMDTRDITAAGAGLAARAFRKMGAPIANPVPQGESNDRTA